MLDLFRRDRKAIISKAIDFLEDNFKDATAKDLARSVSEYFGYKVGDIEVRLYIEEGVLLIGENQILLSGLEMRRIKKRLKKINFKKLAYELEQEVSKCDRG